MSWTDSEGLERGGACNECGDPVEEEHHAYCSDCFAEQQGWSRPDADALRQQRERRDELVTVRLLERVDELEQRVVRLERRAWLARTATAAA